MSEQKIRVGIVGLNANRSWAGVTHVPALRALSHTYEIVGVANTSKASAETAAAACNIPQAFGSMSELVSSPDIDVVTVTVKVPYHLEIVKAAIAAGKHVFCEWPLGNGLAEAEELAALARDRNVLGMVGTQARVAPEILYLRQLIAEGFVGQVLSTTLTAWGGNWGPVLSNPAHAYLLDKTNGATMLTIPMGHTLAALRDVLGDITDLSAITTTRRNRIAELDGKGTLPMTAPDQVLVNGLLTGGAPVSIHYRGGAPRGETGLMWEINGTEGDIRVTGAIGHSQMVQLSLAGGRGNEPALQTLTVPVSYYESLPPEPIPGNVARLYARMAADLRTGTRTAPSFEDAVALHRLIAAIEESSERGLRLAVNAPNRPLPSI